MFISDGLYGLTVQKINHRRFIDMENMAIKDKRLLNINEFKQYASVGRNTAIELAKESGAVFRCGRRFLVDRVRFDQWCDERY